MPWERATKQSKACPAGDHFQCPRTRSYTSHWSPAAGQGCEKRRTVKGKSGENLWSDGRHLEAPVKRILAPGKLQVLVPRVGKYCQGEILTWEFKVWKYSSGILVFANSIIQLKFWLQIKYSQVWWRSTASEVERQKVGLGNCRVWEIWLGSKKFEDVKKVHSLTKVGSGDLNILSSHCQCLCQLSISSVISFSCQSQSQKSFRLSGKCPYNFEINTILIQ